MKKTLWIVALLVCTFSVAQDRQAKRYAKTITAKDLNERLSILASDEYEGRETGKKGQKMAAEYISGKFEAFGLEAPVDGSYYQPVELTESALVSSYFRRNEDKKIGFDDFLYYSKAETAGEEYIRIVMAGDTDENTAAYDGAYVAYAVQGMRGMPDDRMKKAQEAGAQGFVAIIEDDSEFGTIMGRYGPYLQRPQLGLEKRDNDSAERMIIMDKGLAAWIFDKEYAGIESGAEAQVIFNADYLDTPIISENVLGFLKGSEKPDEIIVITSHYDHIGITNGEINNGADDDGSGTTAVLEIAEAFSEAAAKGRGPKRSILFMTVTGEEKGLLGSKYYTDNPIFPLENTITNLNIDMVGRVDEAHEENPNYVYLIGSDKLSQELHELSERVNKTYMGMELDYTYNDENDPNRFYYRSDHYNFAKNNIPIIFYFNGTHPDYHQPSDTVEKINFDILENRARLVFYTAWEIANRAEKITADKL
jgi:hypothetical protein